MNEWMKQIRGTMYIKNNKPSVTGHVYNFKSCFSQSVLDKSYPVVFYQDGFLNDTNYERETIGMISNLQVLDDVITGIINITYKGISDLLNSNVRLSPTGYGELDADGVVKDYALNYFTLFDKDLNLALKEIK